MTPVRRFQTLDPATFLVDEDHGIIAGRQGTQITHECKDLRRVFNVAREENVAERPDALEERALSVAEDETQHAVNGGAGRR